MYGNRFQALYLTPSPRELKPIRPTTDDFSMPSTPDPISCPYCQATVVAEPVSVINEGTTSVDELFEGALNRLVCPECERSFLFETPLLYRDDADRFLVYYLPRSIVVSVDDAIRQMQELYDQIFAELDEIDKPTCRLAVSRNSFIEKIALHQFEYDDRIIEYIKYQLYQHNDDLDPVRHQLFFDFGNSDDDAIVFLAYDRDKGQPEYSLALTRADYDDLAEHVFSTEEMEEELTKLYRNYYISVDDLVGQ